MYLNENAIQSLIADPTLQETITSQCARKNLAELTKLVAVRVRIIRYDLATLTIPNLKAHAKANDIAVRPGAKKDEILDVLAADHASHEGYAVALRALLAEIDAAEEAAHTENDQRDQAAAEATLDAEYDRQDEEYRAELDAQLRAEKDARIAVLAAAARAERLAQDIAEDHAEALLVDYDRDMEAARASRMTYTEIEAAGAVGFSHDPAISETRSRRIGDRGAMFELLKRGAQYWLVTTRWEGARLVGSDSRTYDADQGEAFLADLLEWQAAALAEIVSDYQDGDGPGAAIAPGARVRVDVGDGDGTHKDGMITIVVDETDIRVDYDDGTWQDEIYAAAIEVL